EPWEAGILPLHEPSCIKRLTKPRIDTNYRRSLLRHFSSFVWIIVNIFGKAGQLIGIGVRIDAMTKIEDVAGTSINLAQDVLRTSLNLLPRCEKQRGIEIALDTLVVPDGGPGIFQTDPPIDTDH